MINVLSVILGGGRGSRLYPLTKYRAKPAVPLVGKYRLIDVPISNCLNSGFKKIAILTQFNSESLNKHIFRAYKLDSFSEGFVEIIAADQSLDQTDWFQGSADAVRKSFKHFSNPRIKYILILSGDQLYKMDFRELLSYHIKKEAEITIACNVTDRKDVSEFGIMGVNKDFRIKRFIEKPSAKDDIESLAVKIEEKAKYLASMGIYVFNKDVLFDLLTNNKAADFGREIIPAALSGKLTYAYVYDGYWKDIGSIDSFYEENLAFTNKTPPINLFDDEWKFFTRPRYLPLSKILSSNIENSIIAEGAIIDKSKIIHSIVGLRSVIGSNSIIEDSILMGCDYYDTAGGNLKGQALGSSVSLGIGKNCHIKRTIIDKNVKIGDNSKIINKDNIQEFEGDNYVICNGKVIIIKNAVIPAGTII